MSDGTGDTPAATSPRHRLSMPTASRRVAPGPPAAPDPSLVAPAPETRPRCGHPARTATAEAHLGAARPSLAVNACLVVACFGAAITVLVREREGQRHKVVTLPPSAHDRGTAAHAGTRRGSTPANGTEPEITIPHSRTSRRRTSSSPAPTTTGASTQLAVRRRLRARPFTSNTDTDDAAQRPDHQPAAIPLVPRDLWVDISGSGRMGRINSAFNKDDPGPLMANDLRELRDLDRPLRQHRLLCVQGHRGRRGRCEGAVRVRHEGRQTPPQRPGPDVFTSSTVTAVWPTCVPVTTSTWTPRPAMA